MPLHLQALKKLPLHRSTARLHRAAARRWPTAALSQGSAEDRQGPAPQSAAEGAVGGARRPRAAAEPRAAAAAEGTGQAPLAAAIASATQQFIERMQAAAPADEAVQEMMRGVVSCKIPTCHVWCS